MRERSLFAVVCCSLFGPPIAAYAVGSSSSSSSTPTSSSCSSSPASTTTTTRTTTSTTEREEEEANNINNNNNNNDNFYIHGWRWHTQALARDARRLAQLATNTIIDIDNKIDENKIDDLQQAIEYTVDFNMKGLHKIERDVFFPWVRTTVVPAIPDHDDVTSRKRLREVMDQLERDHWQLHEWGQALVRASRNEREKLVVCCSGADCVHALFVVYF
jgi:hypothetical protein